MVIWHNTISNAQNCYFLLWVVVDFFLSSLTRLLSEIENNDQVYFWIAKAKSIRRVENKVCNYNNNDKDKDPDDDDGDDDDDDD